MRVWVSETQVPQDVRSASLFSTYCRPHPSASLGSPRHLLSPAPGTMAPASGNVALTLPACPSREPAPGAHAPDEGPLPTVGTQGLGSQPPCQSQPWTAPPTVPVLILPGPQALLCRCPSVPAPHALLTFFLPLPGPCCSLRPPGTPHRAHSRRPAPALAVPAVSPTWSGSCSTSVLGLPLGGGGSTVQPPDPSAVQIRWIGFPGGGGTEARPLPGGPTHFYLDLLLLGGSPSPLPAPSSFLRLLWSGPLPAPL